MKTSRMAIAAAGAAAFAVVLAGCGTSPGENGDSGEIELNFLHMNTDDGTWGPAIEAFEEAHPGVTINEQQAAFDDLNSQIQARLSQKDTSIDLISVDGPRVSNMAGQGFLADVSEDGDAIRSETGEVGFDEVTYDGKQYAYPQWTSTNVLYYNKALLAAAGLQAPAVVPEARITWEQLVADATAAQAAGATYGFGFDQVDRYYQLQPVFESAGGGSGLEGDGNLTPAVTGKQWRDTAAWYSSLFESGLSPRGIPVEQMPDQFASGKMAYFVGGPWQIPTFEDSDVDWGLSFMPSFADGKPVTPTGSWTVAVSAYSEKAELAKEFARFITLDPEGTKLVGLQSTPIQQDALAAYLEDLIADGGTNADLATIIRYEVPNTAVPRPTVVAYTDFETIMNSAFSDIRNGGSVDSVLEGASEKLDTVFERYRK